MRGIAITVKTKKGTPQGVVLSPIIWNYNFNDLLELYNADPMDTNCFADNIALLSCGLDGFYVISNLQSAINRATEWLKSSGCRFLDQA